MKIEKKQNYINTMNVCGLHTISGRLPIDEMTDFNALSILPKGLHLNINRTLQQINVRINPNYDINGRERILESFSMFVSKVDEMLKDIGYKWHDLTVTRADFCINSCEHNSYNEYYKLHKLLIQCVGMMSKSNNRYTSSDYLTNEQRSIAFKSKKFEIENYNKAIESNGKSMYTNRLELRTIGTIDDLQHDFLREWRYRLNSCIDMIERVEQMCNDTLMHNFNECHSRQCLYSFLQSHTDWIYSRRQARNLFECMDAGKSTDKQAKNLFDICKLESINKADILTLTAHIKNQMRAYFGC